MRDSFEALKATLVSRYELERELGRGGMSTVYLARDLKHERRVALKVLDRDLATRVGAERFLREIRITAQLQHPHVLTLLDSGEANGTLYYVMPFVDGESLRARLRWSPQLPIEEVLGYTREIADALAYAHDHGVIHRDIKPENVLLSHGHAVVADFGVARAISSAKESANLTMSGFAIGTAAYMSPEQAAGKSEVDGRSDVYSLGCVLFEMLAGRPPFVAPSVEAVLAQQITERPPDLKELRHDVPDHVLDQVYRALAKRPENRFATAKEFEASLRGCLCEVVPGWEAPELEPSVFGVGSAPRITPKRARLITTPGGTPPRRTAWVAAGILIAIVAVAGITSWPWRAETSPESSAEADRSASVAVLPLEFLGPDNGRGYLADAIAEEVIGRLARRDGLRVISRTSTTALSQSGLTLREIADSLRVDHVVEGSVVVEGGGDTLRIAVQLIEAQSDAPVWSGSYRIAAGDVASVHDQIAREIAATLLPASVPDASSETSAARGAAYDAYLRGSILRERRTMEALEAAASHFQEALDADSGFAPAYAGLAGTRMLWTWYGFGDPGTPYRAIGEAIALANRALALDSTLAEALAVRGVASHIGYLDSARALSDLDRAVALKPSSGEFKVWRAMVLLRYGREADAMEAAAGGVSLDPVAPGIRGGYAMVALGRRDYAVALEEARRARLVEPGYAFGELIEGVALLLAGQVDACLAEAWPRHPEVRALCLHSGGRASEARSVIDSLTRAFERNEIAGLSQPGMIAAFHAWTGDVEGALQWLQRAHASTPIGIEERFLESGLFDPIWSDGIFRAGLDRLRTTVRNRIRREVRSAEERMEP